jgi:hypothetical protein
MFEKVFDWKKIFDEKHEPTLQLVFKPNASPILY